jgi:chorismate mutase
MAGRSDLVPFLAQMALDMKADGLFVEVHPNPSQALSDQKQQLTPAQFIDMTGKLVSHRETKPADLKQMQPFRNQLDDIDLQIIQDLADRFRVTGRIGEYKNLHNLAILQPDRYKAISDTLTLKGKELGLDEEFIRLLFETIHTESIRCQINKKNTI